MKDIRQYIGKKIIFLYIVFVKVTQSCPTLCDPMQYRVHGILQARILEWVATLFSKESSQPRDQTQVSHIAVRFFTSWATREGPLAFSLYVGCLFGTLRELYVAAAAAKSLQLCPTPSNTMDCNLPDSSTHGIFQARVLEWVAIAFSELYVSVVK